MTHADVTRVIAGRPAPPRSWARDRRAPATPDGIRACFTEQEEPVEVFKL
jgi:hypothetical protein